MMAMEKRIVNENESMDNTELLNWSMNQLFRAARTIELLSLGPGKPLMASACDATATTILKKLVKTKRGYRLIKQTNPKLARGYARP